MLEESRLIWNEFTGAREPASPYPFYTGTSQHAKNNPIGNNKAKAADLNLTQTFKKPKEQQRQPPSFVQR